MKILPYVALPVEALSIDINREGKQRLQGLVDHPSILHQVW